MDTLLPFVGFAFAASITPGPNNVILAGLGAGFGVRAAVPMAFGIFLGFAAMILAVGLGLAVPFTAWPWLAVAMRWLGVAWLLLMAWQIATAPPPGTEGRRPMGFVGGAMFQWINPKAWMLALGVATAWMVPGRPAVPQLVAMAAIFAVVGVPSGMAWAVLGDRAAHLLHEPKRLRAFNIAMAVLLVASMIPMVL